MVFSWKRDRRRARFAPCYRPISPLLPPLSYAPPPCVNRPICGLLVTTTTEALMITVYAAVIGAGVSVVALCLSAVSLLVHWVRRDEQPEVQAINTRCDQLQLAQADMLDRIEHWTRRDRVRRLRDGAEQPVDAAPPLASPPTKSDLRAVAKAKGFRV